jgi:hypothetical protein
MIIGILGNAELMGTFKSKNRKNRGRRKIGDVPRIKSERHLITHKAISLRKKRVNMKWEDGH